MGSRVENRRSGCSLPVAPERCFRCTHLSPVWRGSVSCSRSSNRTGRFPASGSRKRRIPSELGMERRLQRLNTKPGAARLIVNPHVLCCFVR